MDTLRHQPSIWPVRSDHGACLIVPDRDVVSLQARVESGEFDELSPAQRFQLNARVSITIGPATFIGTVAQHLRHSRARIALETCTVVAKFEVLKLA
jgi:hypothetical protein